MFGKKPASAALQNDPTIRRSYLSPDKLLERPFGDEVQTVGDIFAFSVRRPDFVACKPRWVAASGLDRADVQARRYGDRTAAYYRDVVDVVEESKMIKRPDGTEETKVWK